MRRRQFAKLAVLSLVGSTAVPSLVACTSEDIAEVRVANRWRGADISFTLQEEAIGTQLTDVTTDGSVAPIERILANHGATAARLRVWVNPPTGYSDEKSLLILAKRANAAGLEIVLDLHYSDFWADQTTQTIPAAWSGQTLQQLTATVREYTRGIVSALNAQGTPPSVVQIGNEVTNGMLWPIGQIYHSSGREDWDGFTTLLKAGAEGVQDAPGPSGAAATMLHIQRIDHLESTRYTLDHIFERGVRLDLIGVSYYPFWHGSLATLQTALDGLADRYDKDLVVAETSYPWTLNSGGETALYVDSADALPEAARFPPTPAGQAGYFRALHQVLAQVPNDRGAGWLAWEPGWLPGVDAHPDLGNAYANLTMFDFAGNGLPALSAFRPTGQ